MLALKGTLLILCLSIIAIKSYGQEIYPKAGYSYSMASLGQDVFPRDLYSIQSGNGFSVAAGYNSKRVSLLSLQAEILFHQKGFNYKGKSTATSGYDLNGSFTMNYLEIPLLAKVHFDPFYLNAGFTFAQGLGGTYKQTNGGGPFNYDMKIKFGKPTSASSGNAYYIDHGSSAIIQVGAGVRIMKQMILDIRY